ncbi:MAG: peptidyl-prolyl cis-trans isomerase [Flavobacteriales bacterium]|jgi:hypothetical protein|nr:peptidyl-prolyl cis-trans isomerase [Flavobacteriales bacterium]NCG30375.1 hypothetical protein [Bacteroidota bacterium]MBT3962639.1 peptidyl-prolyl cis-trans isomerase [Flavobacteriales bacterium]MBT4704799.1 peptidyl-prolyl cis-trans isomerase [Flavobacteriales bacterium]MBT4929453.1 peptidyl-prolyl cis-trans isomerase [Flavobacteriales bacterium]
MLPRILIFILVGILAFSCQSERSKEPIVVQIGEKYLTLSELRESIPDDLTAEDSTELASTQIQSWINNELMYDKARYNLDQEVSNIELRVDKYRKELFIFAYEKEMVNQKLDTNISESEIKEFYNENQQIFLLNDYILKVRYVKLKQNSPDIEEVEQWLQSNELEAQQKLDEYCLKYAVQQYTDSSWVYLNELLRELPIEVYNKESFLRSGNFVRFTDLEHLYLLHILELQSKNTLSPLDLESGRIKNLILNKRKIELLTSIRGQLYRDGMSSGKVKIYKKPQLLN